MGIDADYDGTLDSDGTEGQESAYDNSEIPTQPVATHEQPATLPETDQSGGNLSAETLHPRLSRRDMPMPGEEPGDVQPEEVAQPLKQETQDVEVGARRGDEGGEAIIQEDIPNANLKKHYTEEPLQNKYLPVAKYLTLSLQKYRLMRYLILKYRIW